MNPRSPFSGASPKCYSERTCGRPKRARRGARQQQCNFLPSRFFRQPISGAMPFAIFLFSGRGSCKAGAKKAREPSFCRAFYACFSLANVRDPKRDFFLCRRRGFCECTCTLMSGREKNKGNPVFLRDIKLMFAMGKDNIPRYVRIQDNRFNPDRSSTPQEIPLRAPNTVATHLEAILQV